MEPFEERSYVDLQAHSAPLGLTFIPEEGWPEDYWYDLVVVFHGSWNRTTPTGYKLVRVKLDSQGNYEDTEDFVTGWLQNPRPGGGEVLGRPVQVVARPGGVMYVTDDKAGVIYKITYNGEGSQMSESKPDLIRVNAPQPNSVVTSPLSVEGEARGYWFFEASFPVKVLDGDGTALGAVPAQAQRDPMTGEINWMTEDFVPFRATVEFKTPQFATGTLVLEKDNPSGLPEYADELRVPIKFNLDKVISIPDGGGKRPPEGECRPTGCSGEICADKDTPQFSICLWNPEYTCYKDAVCERRSNGECGWTPTPELQSCLVNARAAE